MYMAAFQLLFSPRVALEIMKNLPTSVNTISFSFRLYEQQHWREEWHFLSLQNMCGVERWLCIQNTSVTSVIF